MYHFPSDEINCLFGHFTFVLMNGFFAFPAPNENIVKLQKSSPKSYVLSPLSKDLDFAYSTRRESMVSSESSLDLT